MPRLGRTPERKARHHKPMHSAAGGQGHDSKIRKRKREISQQGLQRCTVCGKMFRHRHHRTRS